MNIITSIHDAVKLILDAKNFASIWPEYDKKFPFGLWFRGQLNSEWELIPSIFRKDDKSAFLDENSLFTHFQLRLPKFNQNCNSTFDWLCLMQHYGLPTRILDWTESILIGLYFAVANNEKYNDKDGKLFALNAKALNHASIDTTLNNYAIITPKIFYCTLRAVMALSNNLDDLLNTPELKQNDVYKKYIDKLKEILDKNDDKTILKFLSYPIAVFPNRNNERIILQSGVFTLHGGKVYVSSSPNNRISDPIHINKFNNNLLLEFLIPKEDKAKIRRELFLLGFHHASLFPELEYQAQYIKEYWSFS